MQPPSPVPSPAPIISEKLFLELRKKDIHIEAYLADEPDPQTEEEAGVGCFDLGFDTGGKAEEEDVRSKDLQKEKEERQRQGSVLDLWAGLSSDNKGPWKRWRLARFVDSMSFQKAFAFLVITNGLLIGVQADVATEWPGWMGIECCFVLAFVIEIGMKLYAFRGWFWGDAWNIFDFVVVLVSSIELLVMLATNSGTSSGLSTLRLVRVLRVIRVLGMFQNLNMLVNAFLRAMKSAIWVAVLLVMVIYVFAILGRGFFGDSADLELHCDASDPAFNPNERCYPSNEATWAAANQFRTVPRSMATLLQIMTGDSWASMVAGPIGDVMPAAWLFFVLFVVLVALGLLNLLTGVFLESLMEITSERNELKELRERKERMKMLNIIKKLFEEFDCDGGNTLDEAEIPLMLKSLLQHQRNLKQVGLPYDKLKRACEISDYDHSHRSYDPETDVHYHSRYRWAPNFDAEDFDGNHQISRDEFMSNHGPDNMLHFDAADVTGKEYLTRTEYTKAFGEASKSLQYSQDNLLPEGTMEGELIDCLMHMDEPLVKADYFTMMKRMRLMERRILKQVGGNGRSDVQGFDGNKKHMAASANQFGNAPDKAPAGLPVAPADMTNCAERAVYLKELDEYWASMATQTIKPAAKKQAKVDKSSDDPQSGDTTELVLPQPEPVYSKIISNPLVQDTLISSETEDPIKAEAQDPLKAELLKIVEARLPRYDYDGSGTINGLEEITQLTTFLAYRSAAHPSSRRGNSSSDLQLLFMAKDGGSLSPDKIELAISDMQGVRGDLERNPMSVAEYVEWLFEAFVVTLDE